MKIPIQRPELIDTERVMILSNCSIESRIGNWWSKIYNFESSPTKINYIENHDEWVIRIYLKHHCDKVISRAKRNRLNTVHRDRVCITCNNFCYVFRPIDTIISKIKNTDNWDGDCHCGDRRGEVNIVRFASDCQILPSTISYDSSQLNSSTVASEDHGVLSLGLNSKVELEYQYDY